MDKLLETAWGKDEKGLQERMRRYVTKSLEHLEPGEIKTKATRGTDEIVDAQMMLSKGFYTEGYFRGRMDSEELVHTRLLAENSALEQAMSSEESAVRSLEKAADAIERNIYLTEELKRAREDWRLAKGRSQGS